MRRLPLALIAVFLGLSPLACSGDDDPPTGLPTGDPELVAMVGCIGEGLVHVGLAIETGIHLFHELDTGEIVAYTPPPEFGYVESTGEFYNQATILGVSTEIDGIVEPVSVVDDGLQQGDIFTVTWWMTPNAGLDVIAEGSLRVIHQGLTLPPNQTETMRIIPAGDIWVDTGGSCHTDVTQFEIHVHHLVNDDEISTVLISFETVSDTNMLSGYLTAGGGADIANISTMWKGESYACDMDMETYELDCYPV